MANILQKVDDKIDYVLEKNTPTGKAAKLNNLWLGTCAATVAAGLYTGIVDWNPIVRIGAHLGGAFAIPAGGAFVSSLATTYPVPATAIFKSLKSLIILYFVCKMLSCRAHLILYYELF